VREAANFKSDLLAYIPALGLGASNHVIFLPWQDPGVFPETIELAKALSFAAGAIAQVE